MGIAAYVKTLPSMPTKLPNVSFHFLLNIRVSFTLVLSMYNSFGLKNHFVSNNLQQCFKWIKKCSPLLQILECACGVFPTLIPTIFVWQISITINLVAVHLTYSFFLLWFRMALFNATPKPKIVKKKNNYENSCIHNKLLSGSQKVWEIFIGRYVESTIKI